MFGKVKSGRTKAAVRLTGSAAVVPDEQLQNKVIAYFANGQRMEVVPVNGVAVTPEQRQRVISQLAKGEITDEELERFLEQVASPLQDKVMPLKQAFQKVTSKPILKQIVAVATGHDRENWQTLEEKDLKIFTEKPMRGRVDYRTPVGFAEFREKFLDGIRGQASAEQMWAYMQAMDEVEKTLYGQRFGYYQQIQLLGSVQKAAESSLSVSAGMGDELVMTRAVQGEDLALQEIIAEETVRQEPVQKDNVGGKRAAQSAVTSTALAALAPEQSNEILSRVEILGDPWQQEGAEYRLNIANLMSGGLAPAYGMNFEGQEMVLSNPFQLSDGRGAALAYMTAGDKVKLRSFYLNPKTGMWHVAPDTVRGARGEGMSQIGEGYGMMSTMLPVAVQQQLSELVRTKGFQEVTTVNPDFLFAGVVQAFNTQQDCREAIAKNQAKNDYYREVDGVPMRENWQANGKNKNVPQLISVNTEMAPNFQAPVVQLVTYSSLAGQVKIDAFPSNDGQLIWVFCSDDWGRAWLGNIEVISPMTTVGCRRDWMKAGDMTTPLYEYSTQVGGYGDATDTRKGMMGMWGQYLSKIPIIQEYIAWRGKQ